jgi:catechol 2,3-dioxygenase-like lactoylglutathione lyase family enzyme
MLNTISHVNLWVHDQDEALAFYTEKLGFEVREDVTVEELGNFRWLTVGPPRQPDVQMVLCRTDAIPASPELHEKLADVVAQGAGGGMIFAVDDCRATVAELKAKGVEFTQEPVDQFYGVDAAFRDPSGNQHRITQRTDGN